MPGINIFISSRKSALNIYYKFNQIMKKMLHFQSYSHIPILAEDCIIMSLTAYESYPRNIFETNHFVIVLEGIIYNKKSSYIKNSLFEIASALSLGETPVKNLKKFLTESDGDFIIIIYDKVRKKLFVMNDLMARVPLYYHVNDDSLFISREIKFITPFLTSINFNKAALMEYLLYGFPFDENTLIEKIYRLNPGTLIKFDSKSGDFSKKMIYTINFDKSDRRLIPGNEIENLKKLFQEGLKNRVEKLGKRKPIISLSGGLDSRATLAGLVSLNIKPKAITTDLNNGDEKNYAISVAKEFKINISSIKPKKQMDIEDYKKIVFLKDGLNSTNMSSMLDILNQVTEIYGNNIVMYTGLYGGETFRYLHLTRGLNSIDNLAKFLLNTNESYKYSTKNVCRMLNISKEHVFRHLQKHLASYKEKNIYKKYIRFRFEKDYRWAGEGEDRNRFFCWTITPFYALPLFNYSISIDEDKKDLLFFRDFLYALDPRTCNIKYYNNKISLNNIWKLHLLRLEERLVRFPAIRKLAKSVISTKRKFFGRITKINKEKVKERKYLRKILIDMLNNSNVIRKYFSIRETNEIIKTEVNLIGLHRIITIFLYIDLLKKWHNLLSSRKEI